MRCKFGIAAVLSIFLFVAALSHADPRPPSLDDIFGMKKVTSVALSADAKYVAFAISIPSATGWFWNAITELKLLNVESGTISSIASGMGITSMSWSPRENVLAYLVNTGDEGQQLWHYDVGANALGPFTNTMNSEMTSEEQSLSQFAWSPDGDTIAYMATAADFNALNKRDAPSKVVVFGADAQTLLAGAFVSVDAYIGTIDVKSGRSMRHTPSSISPM